MSDKQRTLKEEVKFQGVGLHTGEVVNMTIKPAKENHGYKFKRVDLENEPVIKADPDIIFNTPVEKRWEKAVSMLGFDVSQLSSEAGHA